MKTDTDRLVMWCKNYMWILVAMMLTACDAFENAPDKAATNSGFELSSMSNNQNFIVTVSVEEQAQPPIGKFHNWLVRITDAELRPVETVIVSISGGMPSHGHGLPTQPQITEYLGNGIYRLEGVKFNMS